MENGILVACGPLSWHVISHLYVVPPGLVLAPSGPIQPLQAH